MKLTEKRDRVELGRRLHEEYHDLFRAPYQEYLNAYFSSKPIPKKSPNYKTRNEWELYIIERSAAILFQAIQSADILDKLYIDCIDRVLLDALDTDMYSKLAQSIWMRVSLLQAQLINRVREVVTPSQQVKETRRKVFK